jgi:NAD(P)-dependent dehydrogenase (short-subunit alcohol dehydrogenase family)
MAISLASKLKPKGVTAYSLHPGFVWTEGYNRIPRENLQEMGKLIFVLPIITQSRFHCC